MGMVLFDIHTKDKMASEPQDPLTFQKDKIKAGY